MAKTLVEMAAEIIQSQCSIKSLTTEEIGSALQSTFNALQSLQAAETQGAQIAIEGAGAAEQKPEVTPAKSIQKNKIICLECGQEFKMLSPNHLKSHDLTGRDYKLKYGFSLRQPLCAKSLSARRKKAGKERGIPVNLQKAIDARRKKKAGAKRRKKVTGK